jgi:hypothetical protein
VTYEDFDIFPTQWVAARHYELRRRIAERADLVQQAKSFVGRKFTGMAARHGAHGARGAG